MPPTRPAPLDPGPSRPVPGTDVRRYRHVPGQLLIITDARRHRDVAYELWDGPVFCAQTGRNFTQNGRGEEPEWGHGPTLALPPLESPVPPPRLRAGTEIKLPIGLIAYQLLTPICECVLW